MKTWLLLLFPLVVGAQDQGTCASVVDDTSGMTARYLIETLAGGQCTDPPPPPEPCVPETVICDDGTDQDCDGSDEITGQHAECPLPNPPTPGGQVAFEEIDTPAHGSGSQTFGVYIWGTKVGLTDHTKPGNDPVWDYSSGFTYSGQMSQSASIRNGRTIKLSTGVWPVSGMSGFGSGSPDVVHVNGEARFLCASKWASVECQGFGDVNSDGIDDILLSTGVVWDGATLVTAAQDAAPSGTVIGSGISMFVSGWYTKAACLWTDRVLTNDGLFDLQGNLLTTIPDTQIKGGFACGDFDNDGDTDVTYTDGGHDYNPGGATRYVLRNDGDTFTQMSLGGLPDGGGYERRYNLPSTPDFNGDGCADLVLPDHGKAYVSGCDFTFVEVLSWTAAGIYKPVATVGDFDQNGLPDICASTGGPSAKCFRNVTQ